MLQTIYIFFIRLLFFIICSFCHLLASISFLSHTHTYTQTHFISLFFQFLCNCCCRFCFIVHYPFEFIKWFNLCISQAIYEFKRIDMMEMFSLGCGQLWSSQCVVESIEYGIKCSRKTWECDTKKKNHQFTIYARILSVKLIQEMADVMHKNEKNEKCFVGDILFHNVVPSFQIDTVYILVYINRTLKSTSLLQGAAPIQSKMPFNRLFCVIWPSFLHF